MALEKIPYLSSRTLESLYAGVEENVCRYVGDGFSDLSPEGGWDIRLTVLGELEPLMDLRTENGASDDYHNSWIVWRSLQSLTPSLACEGRIWARLCHVESFRYAQKRWLMRAPDDKRVANIRKHFFADSLTGWRDDNALSRLWWNAHIASTVFPDDAESALRMILKRADIRLNFVERSWLITRRPLANGIVRKMLEDEWVTASEETFRAFIKSVNKLGGGIVFELLNPNEIGNFLARCQESAIKELDGKSLSVASG